jgi:chitin synthase
LDFWIKKGYIEESILEDYLKTVYISNYQHVSLEEANMYLAEDRILCLKIYCRKNRDYYLKYIPNAYSWVDAVLNMTVLMG